MLVNLAQKGYPGGIPMTITVKDEGLEIVVSEEKSSLLDWNRISGLHCDTDGLIVYPAPRFSIWVPRTAHLTGGDWQSFEELLRTKIRGEGKTAVG